MATAAVEDPEYSLTQRRIWVVLGGLMLALLLAALDATIVATALPTIVGEMGGLTRLSWVVTAYLLAQTVVTPLYGKLGDLLGRKVVLQGAIVIFRIGSVLCGLARSMTELILFRALQGLGGGGLMVTAQAALGDLVAPRDRGRYQGMFGAVFSVASIAGPLVGGFFTTHLSWRWIFYINLPLGALALAVLAATLPSRPKRVSHVVDYAGTVLLATALSGVVVLTDVGGVSVPWTSPALLALVGVVVASFAGFIAVERRASEPVLPLRLFRDPTFTLASVIGFAMGFALFGSVTYVPVFLQVAHHDSPTASGLQMLPLMGGALITSVLSGQIISRTGRYKVFPVLGTALATIGLFLLSHLSESTPTLFLLFSVLVLGLGLGLVMQVLVLAAQNAVAYADLGVATSAATMFRLIGGSVGTAALGAVFVGKLRAELTRLSPSHTAPTSAELSPAALLHLPDAVRGAYAHAFAASIDMVFLAATATAFAGFGLAWLLPQRSLRETVSAGASNVGMEAGEACAMPAENDPMTELLRGVAAVADRDLRRRYIEGILSRAGVDLIPSAAFLLIQLDRDPTADVSALGRTYHVPETRLRAGLAQLLDRGYLVEGKDGDAGGAVRREVTPPGCDALRKIVAARRARLAELRSEWPAEQRAEMAILLQHIAIELVPEAREPKER
jgi:EmrB/QacA subfamily drug resistance transporter